MSENSSNTQTGDEMDTTSATSTDQATQQTTNTTTTDDQAAKRQRTENGTTNGAASSSSTSSVSSTSSSSTSSSSSSASASSSASSSSPSLSAIQLDEIKRNLQRYVRQVTSGCGVAGCSNQDCVTGGATPLKAAAIITKAKQLYSAKIPSCVPLEAIPRTNTSSATNNAHTPTVQPPAAAAASPSVAPPLSVAPLPAVAESAPAPSIAASSSTPPAPPASVPAPATSISSSAPPPLFPPVGHSSGLFTTPARPPSVPTQLPRFSSRPTPSPAAASTSNTSLSPYTQKERQSPTLTQMIASVTPTLPIKSSEPPIIDASEWIQSLNAARESWEALGSPANDTSVFRPFVQRIYRVFNDLNCLNLSFRIRKDAADRESDKKRVDEADAANKKEAEQTDMPMTDDGNKQDENAAMTDISELTLPPPPLAVPAASSEAAAALLAASVASEFVEPTEFSPAIDYEQLDAFYDAIFSVVVVHPDGSDSRPVLTSLVNGFRGLLNELIFRPLTPSQLHPLLLRAIPIMFENAAMWFDPTNYELLKLLCKFISMLPRPAKKLIVSWMSDVERWQPKPVDTPKEHLVRRYSVDRLERLLGALQQFISVRIYDKQDLRDVVPAVVFISCIHEANEGFAAIQRTIPLSVPKVARLPVPIDSQLFYNDAVNNEVDLKQDFRRWIQQLHNGTAGSTNDFSFFRYNFILDAGSKANLLKYDAQMQQNQVYRDNVISSGMDQRAGYLILEVRRTHIVADTMRALANKTPADYKKPLKIHFQGEKGIDAGGLRRELFSLLIGELFDARYGMFLVDDETRTFKFNPDSLDSPLEFELIGALLGIAIYNACILDVHLPQVYYKQLLGGKPTLDDLVACQPGLAKGLLQLLEFDGDVESTFARDFTVSYESYGEQKIVELKPNGANIPVTNDNRLEFVNLYVEYILEKSISKQFSSFSKGFHRACGGEALKLFRPFELELLICGIAELDFEALESTTRYEDGYTKDSNICIQFWEIVHQELTMEEKRKLLEFTTGSDRVPIRGLASMHLTISKQGPDSDQLPTSHTCFSHLLLPDYSSKEKLRSRLKLALQNSKGFGLI